MKTLPHVCLFLVVAVLLAVPVSRAQDWTTYQSEGFNIQFDIPDNWTTETGSEGDVPYLLSKSPDETVAFLIYAYRDASISTEDLFIGTVNDLDFASEGEYAEEDLNGFHAFVGEGTGTIEGNRVGMFLMAATYDRNNYVAYVFTAEELFDENAAVMNDILNSIAPIEE